MFPVQCCDEINSQPVHIYIYIYIYVCVCMCMGVFPLPVTWKSCNFHLSPKILRFCQFSLQSLTEWLQLAFIITLFVVTPSALRQGTIRSFVDVLNCLREMVQLAARRRKLVSASRQRHLCICSASVATAQNCKELHKLNPLKLICQYIGHQSNSRHFSIQH